MLYDLAQLIRKSRCAVAPTRRGLLKSAAFVALAAGSTSHPLSRVAIAGTSFSAEQKETLLRMARDIYPHETLLDDRPYQAVIDALLSEAEADSKVEALVTSGLAELQSHANATYKCAYLDVKDADEREALLRTIQMTDFFQKVRGALLMGIYNNKSLWSRFGYDGSSWEKGGYIDRGFDKIDWF